MGAVRLAWPWLLQVASAKTDSRKNGFVDGFHKIFQFLSLLEFAQTARS
jgi:hypothetical protein